MARDICPNCKGKGHVMDGAGALLACLSVVLAPTILFDRNDPGGMTRQECPRCEGRGVVRYRQQEGKGDE